MKRYLAQAIAVKRTAQGVRAPVSPQGMAIPLGWHLSEDGTEYIKDKPSYEMSLEELLAQ